MCGLNKDHGVEPFLPKQAVNAGWKWIAHRWNPKGQAAGNSNNVPVKGFEGEDSDMC